MSYVCSVTIRNDPTRTVIDVLCLKDGLPFFDYVLNYPGAPAFMGDVDVAAFVKDIATRLGKSLYDLGITPSVADHGFSFTTTAIEDVVAFERIGCKAAEKLCDLGDANTAAKGRKPRHDIGKADHHWR
jgi:hypothetical protein